MEIKKLDFSEYDNLTGLWRSAGLSHRPRGRDSRGNIQRQFQEANTIFLGTYDEGKLIAAAIVSHNGRKGWINRLAVHPQFRRRSIATQLVQACEKWLRNNYIQIYAVLIEDDNPASEKLFQQCGYMRHDDIIYYTKRLSKDT